MPPYSTEPNLKRCALGIVVVTVTLALLLLSTPAAAHGPHKADAVTTCEIDLDARATYRFAQIIAQRAAESTAFLCQHGPTGETPPVIYKVCRAKKDGTYKCKRKRHLVPATSPQIVVDTTD